MTSIKHTQDDFQRMLTEQVTLLLKYCQEYDAGVVEMALPAATCIRVLAHKTKNSHPLLGQLGLREGDFCTVAPPLDAGSLISECNLIGLELGADGKARYFPNVDPPWPLRWQPFEDWWDLPVARSRGGETLSRPEIVLGLANKEGGSHVDLGVPERHARFRGGEFLGWYHRTDEDSVVVSRPLGACVRAVAHELLLTLLRTASWAFRAPYVVDGVQHG